MSKANKHPLAGIYVAAISPFNNKGSIDFDWVSKLMHFYAEQGAHGALLAGTTGEGTSLSDEERIKLFESALKVKEKIRLAVLLKNLFLWEKQVLSRLK